MTIGCHAEAPPDNQIDLGMLDAAKRDLPAGCPSQPTLAPPVVDPFANPTASALQPLRGRAPGATLVTATGGAANASPRPVNSDGSFCIEVRLIEDAFNTITLVPLDANGCPGRPASINITHQRSNTPDAGVTGPQNIAKGAVISASSPPDTGNTQNVNDGDEVSWAKYSFTDWNVFGNCDKYAWVRVDFGKPYTVTRIRIVWAQGAGGEFARCYSVLLTDKASPTDPEAGGDWQLLKQADPADANVQDFTINPQAARSAALLLYEDGKTSLTLSEDFRLAEFQVYGQDPDAVPPPPQDRCQ